ncbi:MAG: hypothetical protein ABWK01_09325 [Infirmifilum sp.]
MECLRPEETVEILSKELEKEGYLNIPSEDAKTLIIYSPIVTSSILFVRIEEGVTRYILPYNKGNSQFLLERLKSASFNNCIIETLSLTEGVEGIEIACLNVGIIDAAKIKEMIGRIVGSVLDLKQVKEDALIQTDIMI